MRSDGGDSVTLLGHQRDATKRRIENMRALIAEISTRDMDALEICELIQFTRSGGRKYIRDLTRVGVICVLPKGPNRNETPVFRLVGNADCIAKFMASIDRPLPTAAPRKAMPPPVAVPGSCVHICADDLNHTFRINRKPVQRDPLVAAIFGATGRAVT